jgi:signal peptidase I
MTKNKKTKSKSEQPKVSEQASELPKEQQGKPGFFSSENLRSLLILVIAIFAIRSTIASPYHVPTASMEPTIKVGDRLLAYKLAYRFKVPFHDYLQPVLKTIGIDFDGTIIEWGRPERGDIIVFKYPKDPDTDYVKRVVAIAGDEVEIKEDILYLNGEAQERVDHNTDRQVLEDIEDQKELKLLYMENLSGLKHWAMQNIPSARHFTHSNWPREGGPYKVPEDAVFVIGDNRDNSKDSREWQHVPMDYVRGKALFVIWSVYTPRGSNWPSFRLTRFGEWLY